MTGCVVFIKRQSPDWTSLAIDHRASRPIDPRRFVPDHPIPGFPANIETLVHTWNERFTIDFFTVREIIGRLSNTNINAVRQSESHDLSDLHAIERLSSSEHFTAFFHDDDDFFAPDVVARLQKAGADAYEVCVFPLYRIGVEVFTFVREAMTPGAVLGQIKPFDFRFQSNNYGLASRICSVPNLRGVKDHVLGSAFADASNWTEGVFSFAVSATVKTPVSASQLTKLFSSEAALQGQFRGFISQCRQLNTPHDAVWLVQPLQAIATLLESVLAGDCYDTVDSLVKGLL